MWRLSEIEMENIQAPWIGESDEEERSVEEYLDEYADAGDYEREVREYDYEANYADRYERTDL